MRMPLCQTIKSNFVSTKIFSDHAFACRKISLSDVGQPIQEKSVVKRQGLNNTKILKKLKSQVMEFVQEPDRAKINCPLFVLYSLRCDGYSLFLNFCIVGIGEV